MLEDSQEEQEGMLFWFESLTSTGALLVQDPTTGFYFPGRLGSEVLVGVGARTITFFRFVTYAIALYVCL
jgi:hypothetical protein